MLCQLTKLVLKLLSIVILQNANEFFFKNTLNRLILPSSNKRVLTCSKTAQRGTRKLLTGVFLSCGLLLHRINDMYFSVFMLALRQYKSMAGTTDLVKFFGDISRSVQLSNTTLCFSPFSFEAYFIFSVLPFYWFFTFQLFFFLFAFFRNVESSVRYNNKDQNAICTMIQETISSTRSLYVCVQHANVKRSVYEVLRKENSHLFNLDKNILQDKNNVTQVRLWASLSKHLDEKFPASINWKIAYSLILQLSFPKVMWMCRDQIKKKKNTKHTRKKKQGEHYYAMLHSTIIPWIVHDLPL